MAIKRNTLAFGRLVSRVQIGSVCSNELRNIVDDFGSLPVEEFKNGSVCFRIHRICNNVSNAHTAEVLAVRIFNSILTEVAHHISEGNLRHGVQRKDKLHDLYLFWNGLIHTSFDALHNCIFQFKSVRDSAAHVKTFPAAGAISIHDTLLNRLTLKLGEHHDYHQHGLANRCRGIEALCNRHKLNTVLLQFADNICKVKNGTADSVKAVHNNSPYAASTNGGHHILKVRTLCVLAAVSFVSKYSVRVVSHLSQAQFNLAFNRDTVFFINRLSCVN